MNRSTLIISATLLATFAAAAVQDAVVLKRELKEGQTDVYTSEGTVKQTIGLSAVGAGDQEMDVKTTMKLTLGVGKVDAAKGTAAYTMTVNDLKMEAGGAMAGMMGQTPDMPKEIKYTATIDSRNRVTDMKVVGATAQMAMMGSSMGSTLGTLMVEFPEKPVKVGDTWEYDLAKNPSAGMLDAKLTAKLVAEKDVDGVKAYAVNVTGTIPMKMDLSEMMKGSPEAAQMPKMMITGTLEMSSDVLVEKATGRTLSVVNKSKTKNKMEMTEMGMSIDMTGTGTTKMSLAKPK